MHWLERDLFNASLSTESWDLVLTQDLLSLKGKILVHTLTMSIGGPCLWVPPLSSPLPSPFTSVPVHFSGAFRSEERAFSEQKTVSPLLPLYKEHEPSFATRLNTVMQSSAKTENSSDTSSRPGSTIGSTSGGHSDNEMALHNQLVHRHELGRDDLLPRMKLDIPGGGNTDPSLPRSMAGPDDREGATNHSNFDLHLDMKDEHDRDSSMSPSDDRGETAGSDDIYTSPSLEKKKMKRFR